MPTTTPTRPTRPQGANPNVKRAIIALGVVVLIALLGWQVYQLKQPRKGGNPSTDVPALSAVKTFSYVGGEHTTGPVSYQQTPPAGGPHDPVWEDCGVYTQPLRNENVVHSLEHGTVWVTYRPGLPASDVQSLQTALGAVKDKKTILSPYPGLPAPVVVTVWNAELDLKSAADPRLAAFLSFYGDGHTAPEAAMASCAGGKHVYASPNNP